MYLGIIVTDERPDTSLKGLPRTIYGIFVRKATFFPSNSKQTLRIISCSCICKDGFFLLIVCKQTPKTANFMGCFGDESAASLLRMGQHSTTDWLGHRTSQSISIRTPKSVGFQGDGLLFSRRPLPIP